MIVVTDVDNVVLIVACIELILTNAPLRTVVVPEKISVTITKVVVKVVIVTVIVDNMLVMITSGAPVRRVNNAPIPFRISFTISTTLPTMTVTSIISFPFSSVTVADALRVICARATIRLCTAIATATESCSIESFPDAEGVEAVEEITVFNNVTIELSTFVIDELKPLMSADKLEENVLVAEDNKLKMAVKLELVSVRTLFNAAVAVADVAVVSGCET